MVHTKQTQYILWTDETRRMFEASRTLSALKKSNTIHVNDKNGHKVASDKMKAGILKEYYETQFTEGVENPLRSFEGPPRPLNCPITSTETAEAASRLKSNRATGPDQLQNELLKYSDPIVFDVYAKAINESLSTNSYINSIGEGIITPLQKPGKPKGPVTSLRPLTLLNGSRKILTIITLQRIERVIDDYTKSWQCGYKRGRSCGDLIWAQRMLSAVVLRKEWSFCKLGIDMSRAFDTVKRSTIIDVLRDAGAAEDDIRLVQYLLSNTKLKVRVNNTYSDLFESFLGAFQGDSLSGKLFTLVLAAALNHLRAVSDRPNPPISLEGLPTEWAYADDCDFCSEDIKELESLYPIAKDVLQQWNLFINDGKTEWTTVYLAPPDDLNPDGTKVQNNEPWRGSKSLGSLLCTSKDITNRIAKGWQAFTTFEKVWLKGKKISLERKLKLYEAQVISVMMYNCNSWSGTKDMLNKLDVTHRKHLRKILNYEWPKGIISNINLYRRCRTKKLSERVDEMRWKMFGHILRSNDNTPANVSLILAIKAHSDNSNFEGRLGRPRNNLFSTLINDLNKRNLILKTLDNLNDIKDIASCRKCWKNLFSKVQIT